jgi:hypothetical protein
VKIAAVTLLVASFGALSACGGDDDADGAGPTSTARAGTPSNSGTPPSTTGVVPAPIDELELIIRESYPPQYAVRVVSGLPDSCHRHDETRLARSGETFTMTVTNRVERGPDIACAQVYGTHDETVELASDLVPGTEYLVRVNDRELRFTAE